MGCVIKFFWLFSLYFLFNYKSIVEASQEYLNEDEMGGKTSSFDFCEEIINEQDSSLEEGIKKVSSSAHEHMQTSLYSFPFLLDMGVDPVLEAFSFITNCNFSKHGEVYTQKTIKKYQEDVYLISLHNSTQKEIVKNKDYDRAQYIFITLQDDVLNTLVIIKELKKQLKLNLDNQVKLVMFSPSGLNNIMVQSYSEQINRKNIVSFNLQYNWYNFQISRSACPIGVNIDIPYDKHNKGFRLSRLNPVDTCIDPLQSPSAFGVLKETLREIYEKALHKWNFRMDAIENGMFKDENEILNKMGIYSPDSIRTTLLAFLGGYES